MRISKKVLSLLAVLALMGTMLSVTAIATVGAEATNLVTNGTFDSNNINGWSCVINTAHVWGPDPGTARSGSYSLNGGGANLGYNSALYQVLTVEANKSYTVTAYIKAQGYVEGMQNDATTGIAVIEGVGPSVNNIDRLGNLMYYMWDEHFTSGSATYDELLGSSEGNGGINDLGGYYHTGGFDDWKQVTFNITPKQNTIVLGIIALDAYVWFDDISVVENSAGVIFTNQTITKTNVTENSVTITWGAAGGESAASDITYSVYKSTSKITVDNIGSLTPFTTVNGASELKATATGLTDSTNYYFAVKAADTTPTEALSTVTIFSDAIRTLGNSATEILVNGGFENIKVDTGVDQGFCDSTGINPHGSWGLIPVSGADPQIGVDDFGTVRRKITSQDKHDGNYAVSFPHNSDFFRSLVQYFDVMKGYKYTITFWYKGEAGSVVGITPASGDWGIHSTASYPVQVKTNKNEDWTKYTMVYYPSADGETSLWLTGPAKDDGGESIFDSVSVKEEYAPLYFTTTSIPVTKITKNSIDISWTAPTVQTGADAVTGYKIYCSESPINADNVASLTPTATAAVGTTATSLTGLTPNTGYYIAVAATNGTYSTYVFNGTPTYTQKDEAAPAAGTNLIIDGGFDVSETFNDNPREGWHRLNDAGEIYLMWSQIYADVGDPMKAGSVCVYPWQQNLVQWVQVKPNTTYAYCFRVKGDLPDGGPGFRIYERANGAWNGKLLAETKVTAATDGMQYFQGSFTTGADTTEVYVNPHNMDVSTGSGGQCYFDEIYMIEVEDTSLYMLGGITQAEYGEDYLIVSWPKAASSEADSKLTYKVFASDEPITAANIGSLTAFATVKGDEEFLEAELGDLEPGTMHYFAVSVTNSQGKTAYLFSDNAFMTDGEPGEEEDPSGGNTEDPSGDNTGDTGDEDDPSPTTGDPTTLLTVALLTILVAGILVFSKRRTIN